MYRIFKAKQRAKPLHTELTPEEFEKRSREICRKIESMDQPQYGEWVRNDLTERV